MADETKQDRTPEEIRADIESTREDLGDTVEALSAKTDVKARAKDRVAEVKADARSKVDDVKSSVTDALPGGGDDRPRDPDAPSAGERLSSAGQTVTEKAKANPLPLAVGAALILGFMIGRARR